MKTLPRLKCGYFLALHWKVVAFDEVCWHDSPAQQFESTLHAAPAPLHAAANGVIGRPGTSIRLSIADRSNVVEVALSCCGATGAACGFTAGTAAERQVAKITGRMFAAAILIDGIMIVSPLSDLVYIPRLMSSAIFRGVAALLSLVVVCQSIPGF